MKQWCINGLVVVLMPLCFGANAATFQITSKVTRLFTHDSDFGGCMVFVDPTSETSSCAAKWLTLDCNDSLNQNVPSASRANKFQAAQLAHVTDENAVFYFDNTKKINGFCYVYRVDNR